MAENTQIVTSHTHPTVNPNLFRHAFQAEITKLKCP